MQTYHIHELERLTGVKAHTIRIWEKRYGIIAPLRTATNRRYYSDDQVRKLLNVTTLLSQGRKISKIAELSDEQLNRAIKEKGRDVRSDVPTGYINALLKAMVAYNEAEFDEIFFRVVSEMGMYDAVLTVIYPFLEKTGTLWCAADAIPAQEHFASCMVRKKIIAATAMLGQPKQSKTFLLFLPAGEWHEIGLLFADYIIRARGYRTVYLGQNMPAENVQAAVAAVEPAAMLLFYVTTKPVQEITEQVTAYAAVDKKINVLVAGAQNILPGKTRQKNVTYLTGVDDLLELL